MNSEIDKLFNNQMTEQEILLNFYEKKIRLLMLHNESLGLKHITNNYENALKLEKEECRKALGNRNKNLFYLIDL